MFHINDKNFKANLKTTLDELIDDRITITINHNTKVKISPNTPQEEITNKLLDSIKNL